MSLLTAKPSAAYAAPVAVLPELSLSLPRRYPLLSPLAHAMNKTANVRLTSFFDTL